MSDLVLHEFAPSGNCYKIRLTASHVGQPIARRSYDILKGETRTPEFLAAVNANGRIPTLQIGETFLPESNAACLYLAHGTSLIPKKRFAHADMMRWLFWEQYNHEPNVATLRFWYGWVGEDALSELQLANLPGKRDAAIAALALMDNHLSRADWFAAGQFTIADIALYAYTHVAEEGQLDLAPYPHLRNWLARVAAQPGHVPIDA